MYHFVYKTTNTLNGKFYIGKHSTNNLNDGYFGSGSALLDAINKHGKENFKVEIIEFFETEKEAVERERAIVTKEFCQRDDTYNINVANQQFTWTGISRPEQSIVIKTHKPWLNIKNRHNPSKGKPAHNRKRIRITNEALGIDIEVESLRVASEYIGIDRANARKILQGVSKSRKGWILTQI
jgi:group I intron endonuclease